MRRPGLTLLLMGAVVLSGCFAAGGGGASVKSRVERVPTDSADASRDAGKYWMVRVRGTETQDPRPEAACTLMPPDYTLNETRQVLRYAPEKYAVNEDAVRTLVAFAHYREDGCYEAWDLVPDPGDAVARAMGGYGMLTISVQEDGRVIVDGTVVPLREALIVSYESRDAREGKSWTGAFRVENLGAWDRADIRTMR